MTTQLRGDDKWQGKIFSGGWIDGGGDTYVSEEPAAMQRLREVGAATAADVGRAVQRASKAQPGWAATPYDRRAAVLRRAADLLEEHQKEVEDWVVREAGLPRYFAGVRGAAEEFRQAAALASAPRGEVLATNQSHRWEAWASPETDFASAVSKRTSMPSPNCSG
jgi:benzaldehyde dehydrogenase (NAD)